MVMPQWCQLHGRLQRPRGWPIVAAMTRMIRFSSMIVVWLGVACDRQPPEGISIPVLEINDIQSIASFIYNDFYLRR